MKVRFFGGIVDRLDRHEYLFGCTVLQVFADPQLEAVFAREFRVRAIAHPNPDHFDLSVFRRDGNKRVPSGFDPPQRLKLDPVGVTFFPQVQMHHGGIEQMIFLSARFRPARR